MTRPTKSELTKAECQRCLDVGYYFLSSRNPFECGAWLSAQSSRKVDCTCRADLSRKDNSDGK